MSANLDQIINQNEKIQSNNEKKIISNFDDLEESFGNFKIKIFGIGGAGCNAVTDLQKTHH